MKILAIDIGTGTQDILLFDPRLSVENAFKLVLPSPTMIVRNLIRKSTIAKKNVLLTGVTMGGGPSSWAIEDHIRSGLTVFATPSAARSFNDDLDRVAEMGVKIISEDEALRIPEEVERLEVKDLDLPAIQKALAAFGVGLDDLAAVAVAVFDHGAAPADVSDRKFRFDYLNERIRETNRLSAFAFTRENIPPIMTRLQAVASSAGDLAAPLIVMDTAPAAILGATFDPLVSQQERVVIANLGNFHTLAFRLGPAGIEGVFEHHTGLLTRASMENLISRLADSSLENQEVFDSHGHGALIYTTEPLRLAPGTGNLVVTGPRRAMLAQSSLKPYFAVPFSDMMLTGCFGLLAATADLLPSLADAIQSSLNPQSSTGGAPWDY